MSAAIEVLRDEHDAILIALSILDKMVEQAKSGTLPPADAASFVSFLREFADKCHHGKEEGLLFPAMIAAGLPADGGPVSVMLQEHEQGRALVAAMNTASQPPFDATAFANAATAYAAHLRAHIAKENNVLFQMAENVLSPETLSALNKGFEEHEEQVIGHGRHEELHAMLKELKARYLSEE